MAKVILIVITVLLSIPIIALAGPPGRSSDASTAVVEESDSKVEVVDTGSGYVEIAPDNEQQVKVSDGYVELIDGLAFRVITTTDGHTTKFQVYDTNGTTWRDVLTFENGDSSDSDANNHPRVHLGANTALTGLGNMSVGMNWGSPISTNTVLTYESANQLYLVTAAVTATLPDVGTSSDDAQYGDWVQFRVQDASEVLTIDCDAADKINRQGTAQAAGVDIDTPGTAGDVVTCTASTDVDGAGTDGWFCDSNVTLAAGS